MLVKACRRSSRWTRRAGATPTAVRRSVVTRLLKNLKTSTVDVVILLFIVILLFLLRALFQGWPATDLRSRLVLLHRRHHNDVLFLGSMWLVLR